MWTTNPEQSKLLENPEDGYKYTQRSNKKINWICPDCGNHILNKNPNEVFRRGLSCNKCSDGVSYPEKFISSLLNQLTVSYEKEKSFDWAKNKRYDFYTAFNGTIIEVHGMQHYGRGFQSISKRARNLNIEKDSDDYKKESAMSNNIEKYIVIDARYSELEWIKKSVLESELPALLNFNENDIDWLKCHLDSMTSNKHLACELWKITNNVSSIMNELKVSRPTVISWLKDGKLCGWCNYDAKEETSKAGKANGGSLKKKVRCIETDKTFNSILEASKYYNTSDSHISQCCNGKRNVSGSLEDGTKLHWKYETI